MSTEDKNINLEPDHNLESGDNWSRREWIKVVGVATAGLSLMGISPLLAQNSTDVKFENGALYVKRETYASLLELLWEIKFV
ncbi:hypothetical protein INT81_09915 [Riemerella anatipestifer]|nr:hypothetical protein [Riemerella anatipestifer]